MDKVAVFVDVQNIYYTTRSTYSCNFNYNVFWAEATRGREVIGAFAYAIDRGDEKQRKFQNILKRIGFEVKLKPFIQRSDGSAKGDWDVGITLDVMDYASQADIIVLASGDGDFDMLMERASTRHGAFTEVYGVPQLTAASLIHSAHRFCPITEHFLLKG